ncbi:MarR family winged helix-turn-helix transcriptional regulator [Terriglobus roseus]|uniref:DNA-binding transcriptional regulator, MarR family n=1 Tax=Terriglobus roseus TaxID=392734 RepID=A0A1G7HFA5_9BACT|nr:winged helix-turn-helix transcriptional regulator [Terriglobus roseus]SDE99058.1 DNA-binding transcriptional regulator, MarR family [Terriglobus roseus]
MAYSNAEPLTERKKRRQNTGRVSTSEDRDLAAALRSSILRIERNIRKRSRSMGRSAIELHVLEALDRHPGITQSELAQLEHMSRPSMGAHIRKLHECGYIRIASMKKVSAGNPAQLHLTNRGRAFVRRAANPGRDWLTQRLALLKVSEHKQLSLALDSLQSIIADK